MTLTNIASNAIPATCLSLALSLANLSGCALDDEDTTSDRQGVLSHNVLSHNVLSHNVLSHNVLSHNGLEGNLEVQDLANDEEGRQLLSYVFRCALDDGESIVVTAADGIEYDFPGLLGIAPEWRYNAIATSRRQAMTACLMAHVNFFGISVPISLRSPEVDASDQEKSDFPYFEGAFFGNILGGSNDMYACGGDAYDPTTAGWRSVRVCTDAVDGTTTECGFTYVGACSDVCTISTDGTYQTCSAGGQNFASPMSVYLID